MTQPGRFWRTDALGLILNDASAEHIQPPFEAVLHDIVTAYTRHIPNDIHSIYITGSIPRGVAIEGRSDIDVFAVLESQLDPELVMRDWMPEAEDRIFEAHKCVSDVQMELWPYGYVFRPPEEFSIGAFVIKTHSVCVWGNNIAPQLPDYRIPDDLVAIANDDIVQLRPDIKEAIAEIKAYPTASNTRYWAKRTCKNILRAGFGLVCLQENAHTRDIGLCCATFAKYYPKQTKEMERALTIAEHPRISPEDMLAFFESHGTWMIETCDQWLDTHNPKRYFEYRYDDTDE